MKLKRIKALLMSFTFAVVLISSHISSYAVPPEAGLHMHRYKHFEQVYYSSTAYHHDYYEHGQYKTCDVVGYHYCTWDLCTWCGDITEPQYGIYYTHMQCGQ